MSSVEGQKLKVEGHLSNESNPLIENPWGPNFLYSKAKENRFDIQKDNLKSDTNISSYSYSHIKRLQKEEIKVIFQMQPTEQAQFWWASAKYFFRENYDHQL